MLSRSARGADEHREPQSPKRAAAFPPICSVITRRLPVSVRPANARLCVRTDLSANSARSRPFRRAQASRSACCAECWARHPRDDLCEMPSTAGRSPHAVPTGRHRAPRIVVDGRGKRPAIPIDHRLDHLGGRDTWQVRTARRGFQRQTKADEIVGGIGDHRLVEIADLDIDAMIRIRHRPQIAEMTIAANPHGGSFRNAAGDRRRCEPFVELCGIAANIGMDRPRHLERTGSRQHGRAFVGSYRHW